MESKLEEPGSNQERRSLSGSNLQNKSGDNSQSNQLVANKQLNSPQSNNNCALSGSSQMNKSKRSQSPNPDNSIRKSKQGHNIKSKMSANSPDHSTEKHNLSGDFTKMRNKGKMTSYYANQINEANRKIRNHGGQNFNNRNNSNSPKSGNKLYTGLKSTITNQTNDASRQKVNNPSIQLGQIKSNMEQDNTSGSVLSETQQIVIANKIQQDINTVSYLKPVSVKQKRQINVQNFKPRDTVESETKRAASPKEMEMQKFELKYNTLNQKSIGDGKQQKTNQNNQKSKKGKTHNSWKHEDSRKQKGMGNKRDQSGYRDTVNQSHHSIMNRNKKKQHTANASKSGKKERSIMQRSPRPVQRDGLMGQSGMQSARGNKGKSSPRGKLRKESDSPDHKKSHANYMDSIADQEANMISLTSLQEGEEFEKDINQIINIIDSVERNMCQQRLNNQFKRSANLSYNRRKLEMTRTVQAQNNHQNNFTAVQQQIQMYNALMTKKYNKGLSQSVVKLQNTNKLQNSQRKLSELPNAMRGAGGQNMVSMDHNSVNNQMMNPNQGINQNNNQDTDKIDINGLVHGGDANLPALNGSSVHQRQGSKDFNIRVGKKRPMTTRRDANQAFTTKNTNYSMQGLKQNRLSGAFQFNKNNLNAQKDKTGGGHSEERTQDQMTSAVTGTRMMGHESSQCFHHTQKINPGYYLKGGAESSVGNPISANLNSINPGNQESEILSDQTPVIMSTVEGGNNGMQSQQHYLNENNSFKEQDFFFSPKNVDQQNFHQKDRIASAKEFKITNRVSGMQRNFHTNQYKSQKNMKRAITNNYTFNISNDNEHSGSPVNQRLASDTQNEEDLHSRQILQNNLHRFQNSNADFNDGTSPAKFSSLQVHQHLGNNPGMTYNPLQVQFQRQLANNMTMNNLDDLWDNGSGTLVHHATQYSSNYVQGVNSQGKVGCPPHLSSIGPMQNKAGKSNILMQVNKYIPHYQRIPMRFEKRDYEIFQDDFSDEGINKIRDQIHSFDLMLVDSLMGDREKRYQQMHKGHLPGQIDEQDDSRFMDTDARHQASINERSLATDNEFFQHHQRSNQGRGGNKIDGKTKDRFIGKKVKNNNSTIPQYDSDEERENGHQMFMNDLKGLRQHFIKAMMQQVQIQEEMREKFNKEREFFLQCAQKDNQIQDNLAGQIKKLEDEIIDERDYSTQIWADAHVSMMCQKAIFNFKYLQQSQDCSMQNGDKSKMHQEPIFVAQEDQVDRAHRKASTSMESIVQTKGTAQGKSIEIEKDNDCDGEQDRTAIDMYGAAIGDSAGSLPASSARSIVVPSAVQEQHKLEIENLKWQIEYEKKLQAEIVQLLENKVSNLMAQKKDSKRETEQLTQQIKDQEKEKEKLQETIQTLEDKIKEQGERYVDLVNENDDLRLKGGALSQVNFDKLKSELSIAQSDIIQKQSQIQKLEQDLRRTINALRDFQLRMVKLDNFAQYQTTKLHELVDQKVLEQQNRIQVVTETLREALMFSNKTYFLEEVNKHKFEKKNLKKVIKNQSNKIIVLQKTISQKEQQHATLLREYTQMRTQECNVASQEYAGSQASANDEASIAGNANSFYKESLNEGNKPDGTCSDRQRHVYKSGMNNHQLNIMIMPRSSEGMRNDSNAPFTALDQLKNEETNHVCSSPKKITMNQGQPSSPIKTIRLQKALTQERVKLESSPLKIKKTHLQPIKQQSSTTQKAPHSLATPSFQPDQIQKITLMNNQSIEEDEEENL